MKKILILMNFCLFFLIVLMIVMVYSFWSSLNNIESESSEVYAIRKSPGGKYTVVARHSHSLLDGLFPGSIGGSGDGSGYLYFYDSDGNEITKMPVDMVQQITDLFWYDESVSLPGAWDIDLKKSE